MTTTDGPIGTVTFLAADIEGSGDLADELGADYRDAIELHEKVFRSAVRLAHQAAE